MDGMDMGGMGMGHDPGVGMGTDYAFARGLWYIVAGTVAVLVVLRGINHLNARQRRKACHDVSVKHPTRPQNAVDQAWATATALVREMGHPQLYIPIRGLRWASPPPLGRVLVLLCYCAVVIYLMSWQVSKDDIYYWERIGYRNAWVTLAQLPLLYLLSMKINIIGILIGSSHERLSWLHRWVGRIMFVTATVHGFHFWTMWARAEFIETALEIMPLTKYGLGAWGILLWNVVVGFVPIRRLAYEVWLVQHVLLSIAMLALLHMHIPANARYLLWMAVSFLAGDRLARWMLFWWRNARLRYSSSGSRCQGMKRIGHRVTARAVGAVTTVINIKDVKFTWEAGQHVYLWVPRLGPVEAHPYTIACARPLEGTCCCSSIQLVVRAQGGFSKRIHDYARRHPTGELTGFVAGPYGAPPQWDIYETVVLIGASTGSSFTLPIFESIATAQRPNCTRRVEIVLIARGADELEHYVARARTASRMAADRGLKVRIHLAITGSSGAAADGETTEADTSSTNAQNAPLEEREQEREHDPELQLEVRRNSQSPAEETGDSKRCCCCEKQLEPSDSGSSQDWLPTGHLVCEYDCRPDLGALIREPVEMAEGETAVVVCGGREIVARVRNCVSRLSDERAVHKGTGAQGIYLHVEEYSF